MELTERKQKILNAIVRNYLESGEPVGSRTISRYTDLNLSSATIRNEMADLEEMGLILQPHTSAGRIPSDRGYRVYVDQMLARKEAEVEQMREMLLDKEEKLEDLLKQVARRLAADTNYATMISAPLTQGNKIKFLQVSRMDEGQLLITTVMEGNLIKNTVMDVQEQVSDQEVLKLNMLINTRLCGLEAGSISLGLITAMKQEAGEQGQIVSRVIDAIAETIREDEDLEIYTSGTNNIFRYPELSDRGKASEFIDAFENKEDLQSLVEETLSTSEDPDKKNAIQVYIGSETKVQTMRDC
ncbi:MAG: heat-inducible transcription repressor HrcA, partial [Lachnospiraceae bacterium]|nr:heat-inducible transcription repressor HrcA [Lachnospiraceae bacterium]